MRHCPSRLTIRSWPTSVGVIIFAALLCSVQSYEKIFGQIAMWMCWWNLNQAMYLGSSVWQVWRWTFREY